MRVNRSAVPAISDERLRRLFEANVVGILIATNSGGIVDANDAFLAMIGYSRDDLRAGRIDWRRMTPPEWDASDEQAIRELDRDGVFGQFEKEYFRKDGSRVPISVGGARLSETDDAQICYIVDLSDIRRANAATAAAIAALRESEARYRTLAEALPQIVMLADRDRRIIYANRHYETYTGIPSAEIAERWSEPIHPDDLERIVQARQSGDDYDIEYRLRRASDDTFRWHYARTMKLPATAEQPAQWLATAMDIDDRKRAEDALRFIARAGARLSQSLDLEATFATLLDLIVPEFGDWAMIMLRDTAGNRTVRAVRHTDASLEAHCSALIGHDLYTDAYTGGTISVYETGEPKRSARFTEADLSDAIRPQFHAPIRALGFGSYVSLPIALEEGVLGSITVVSASARRTYVSADLPPLVELTRHAETAIANARRYEREHRLADLLQRASLPQILPSVAGVRFDGFYQAGRSEALIGGDWYDAIVLADGRIVISIGDVAGSGLAAAVLMSNIRHVIRAAAYVHADPLHIFDVADRTLRSEPTDLFVTAFVAVLDPTTLTLQYASAGHLPALVRAPDGSVTALDAPGLPLGFRHLAPSESRTARLERGSHVLLYTDGLVEWSRDILAGEARLRATFAEMTAREHISQAIVAQTLAGTSASDDIAVLTVELQTA